MKTMRFGQGVALAAVAFVLLGGCRPKPVELTPRQRKEALQLASEAEFAMAMKDWARAEKLFTQTVQIAPEPAYWIRLGTMRVRLGQRAAARDAYRQAIRACEAHALAHPTEIDPWLKEAYALALLGKVEEGRAVIEKAAKRFPDDRNLRTFIERRQFDAAIAAPEFKEISL